MGHVTSNLPFALGVTPEDIQALEDAKNEVERIAQSKRTYKVAISNGYVITTNPKRYIQQQ